MICRIRFICRIEPNNFVVIIKRVIVITIISSYIRRLYQIWRNWDKSFQKRFTTVYIITTHSNGPSIQIMYYIFWNEQIILHEIIQHLTLCSSEYLKEGLGAKKCQTCWHFWRMNFYCTMVCRLAVFRIQN